MANWYVSQKVAASGAGTSLAVAFKTIAEALTACTKTGGDTIYIHEGIYDESVHATGFTEGVTNVTGKGYVELNGYGVLSVGIDVNVTMALTFNVRNIKVKNFITYSARCIPQFATLNLYNCFLVGNTYSYNPINYYNTILIGDILGIFSGGGAARGLFAFNSTFVGNVTAIDTFYEKNIRNCLFRNGTVKLVLKGTYFSYNNFDNCSVTFNNTTPVLITTKEDLVAKWTNDGFVDAAGWRIDTCEVYTPVFNNSAKDNYTLKYDANNNPIAFARFSGQGIGTFQAAANVICKATASSGNCDIYDISADAYSLGLFGGVTNVGAIDNVNEKLYRTSDGANNWGVFVASTDLPRSHIIKNLQMFGTIIDRNGDQVSETPGDFAYNYQIDVLVKWSATLSKAALLADTSIPFVRFRLRPNEYNYYVDNSGTLVGDGDPGYAALVSSVDGGAGALPPQKIVGKSFVAIIILQDA